jgi:hypothetical protein
VRPTGPPVISLLRPPRLSISVWAASQPALPTSGTGEAESVGLSRRTVRPNFYATRSCARPKGRACTSAYNHWHPSDAGHSVHPGQAWPVFRPLKGPLSVTPGRAAPVSPHFLHGILRMPDLGAIFLRRSGRLWLPSAVRRAHPELWGPILSYSACGIIDPAPHRGQDAPRGALGAWLCSSPSPHRYAVFPHIPAKHGRYIRCR